MSDGEGGPPECWKCRILTQGAPPGHLPMAAALTVLVMIGRGIAVRVQLQLIWVDVQVFKKVMTQLGRHKDTPLDCSTQSRRVVWGE